MVGRSSELSLSKYSDSRIETVHNNNGKYFFAAQGIGQTKTSTFQDICIYIDR